MKVVGLAAGKRRAGQRLEAFGQQGDDAVAVLDDAFDHQRGVAQDRRAPLVEAIGVDDGVGEARTRPRA